MRSAPKVSGFTLVEVLLGTALLVIFFSAVAAMVQMSLQLAGRSRVTSLAQNLLQQEMETLRNMPYVDLGTVGGIPAGTIEQERIVTQNGMDFQLATTVTFVDDPYDEVAPVDTTPTDYKQVRLAVDWDGVFAPPKPLVLVTNVAPEGLESDAGGGTLIIQVLNASGVPVTSAQVTIVNDVVSPAVNMQTFTNGEGLVELPGAEPCIECYQISVTKTGHTTDRTYAAAEVANPSKPFATVIEGDITETSFSIDVFASVTFKAVRSNYVPFQGVQMSVRGNKEIGRTTLDEPVYKFNQAVTTGTGGQVTLSNIEWDMYTVSIPAGSSVDMAGSWPISPFSVLPGSSIQYTMVVVAATDHSLLVIARDNSLNPLSQASVTILNEPQSILATQSTAAIGFPDQSQTFFDGLPATLEPYHLIITAPGFLTTETDATVSGDAIESFIMSPES
jgi:type II secretory pathway pseudopilin PulG